MIFDTFRQSGEEKMVVPTKKSVSKRSYRKDVDPIASKKAYVKQYKQTVDPDRVMMKCCKIDKHYVDLAQTAYANDTTGSIALIATVPQGTTQTTRVGKKIVWDSIQMKGETFGNAAGIFNRCMNLVVYDKRPTGALPAITDILVAANAMSHNNDDNSNRFRIIRKWYFHVLQSNIAAACAEYALKHFDEFIPLHKYCEYKSLGTGAIADIEEGALYFVTVGNNVAGTAAASTAMVFRTRYHEV